MNEALKHAVEGGITITLGLEHLETSTETVDYLAKIAREMELLNDGDPNCRTKHFDHLVFIVGEDLNKDGVVWKSVDQALAPFSEWPQFPFILSAAVCFLNKTKLFNVRGLLRKDLQETSWHLLKRNIKNGFGSAGWISLSDALARVNLSNLSYQQRALWLLAMLDTRDKIPASASGLLHGHVLKTNNCGNTERPYNLLGEAAKTYVHQRLVQYIIQEDAAGKSLYRREVHCKTRKMQKRYNELTPSDGTLLVELAPHIAYMAIVEHNDQDALGLVALLKSAFGWLPYITAIEDLRELKTMAPKENLDYLRKLQPADDAAENRNIVNQAYCLIIAACVKKGFVAGKDAVDLLAEASFNKCADPSIWLVYIEALTLCGSPASVKRIIDVFDAPRMSEIARCIAIAWVAACNTHESCDALVKLVQTLDNPRLLAAVIIAPVLVFETQKSVGLWSLKRISFFLEAVVGRWRRGFPVDQRHTCLSNTMDIFLGYGESIVPDDIANGALHDTDPFIPIKLLTLWAQRVDEKRRNDVMVTDWPCARSILTRGCISSDISIGSYTNRLLEILCKDDFPVAVRNQLVDSQMAGEIGRTCTPQVKEFIDILSMTDAMTGPEYLLALNNSTTDAEVSHLLELFKRDRSLLRDPGIYIALLEKMRYKTINVAQKAITLASEMLLPLGIPEAAEKIIDCALSVDTKDFRMLCAMDSIEDHIFEIEALRPGLLNKKLAKHMVDFNVGLSDGKYSALTAARAYALLLRISQPVAADQGGGGIAKWQTMNQLLIKLLCNADAKSGEGAQKNEAVYNLLSAYRLALDREEKNAGSDDYGRVMNTILVTYPHGPEVQNQGSPSVDKLLVSMMGLKLTRIIPPDLVNVLTKLTRIALNDAKSSLDIGDCISSVRKQVKALYLRQHLPTINAPEKDDHANETSNPFYSTILSYIENWSTVNYGNVVECVKSIREDGISLELLESYVYEAGSFFLKMHNKIHDIKTYVNARNAMHNIDNMHNVTTDDQVREKLVLLRRDLHGFLQERPHRIKLYQFLEKWRVEALKMFGLPNRAICVECSSSSLAVIFDERRLRSILDNCLSNAKTSVEEYNASDPPVHRNPSITITCGLVYLNEQPWVELCIEDNGYGLTDMDPFAANQPEGRETGLGTWIIKEYLSQQNGTVTCRNRGNNNEGALVNIRIPSRI